MMKMLLNANPTITLNLVVNPLANTTSIWVAHNEGLLGVSVGYPNIRFNWWKNLTDGDMLISSNTSTIDFSNGFALESAIALRLIEFSWTPGCQNTAWTNLFTDATQGNGI